MSELTMIKISLVFNQNEDTTWDAVVLDHPELRVYKAEDRETARAFIRELAKAEFSEYKIHKELWVYYE